MQKYFFYTSPLSSFLRSLFLLSFAFFPIAFTLSLLLSRFLSVCFLLSVMHVLWLNGTFTETLSEQANRVVRPLPYCTDSAPLPPPFPPNGDTVSTPKYLHCEMRPNRFGWRHGIINSLGSANALSNCNRTIADRLRAPPKIGLTTPYLKICMTYYGQTE